MAFFLIWCAGSLGAALFLGAIAQTNRHPTFREVVGALLFLSAFLYSVFIYQ